MTSSPLPVTNLQNLDRIRHVQIKIRPVHHVVDFVVDAGFSVTNLGNLDRIRHNQGFPRQIEIRFVLLPSSSSQIWEIWTGSDTFRSDQDQTCPPCSASHFPSQIWEILSVSDSVQISEIRPGKSSLSQPFSVTNLGNPDHV